MARHRQGRRLRILTRDKWICYLCGTDLSKWPLKVRGKNGMGGNIHIDHVLPVVSGGTHEDGNLAVTCKPCNLAKGDRTPEDYRADDRALDLMHGTTVADRPDNVRGSRP